VLDPGEIWEEADGLITCRLESAATVELAIYNVLGQRVRHGKATPRAAGPHEIRWDDRDDRGRRVVSGLYFYRVKSGNVTRARKVLLLK
jgi:flagellar hook assembly protein FlgD